MKILTIKMIRLALVMSTLSLPVQQSMGGHGNGGLPRLAPIGSEDILYRVAVEKEPVTVVHFWSLSNDDSVREFPETMRAWANLRPDVAFILVCTDAPDSYDDVWRFLFVNGVNFASYMADGFDGAYVSAFFPDWSGKLPATFVFASGGSLDSWWQGAAPYEAYVYAAQKALLRQAGAGGSNQPGASEAMPGGY